MPKSLNASKMMANFLCLVRLQLKSKLKKRRREDEKLDISNRQRFTYINRRKVLTLLVINNASIP
jgi:hypothetical protein